MPIKQQRTTNHSPSPTRNPLANSMRAVYSKLRLRRCNITFFQGSLPGVAARNGIYVKSTAYRAATAGSDHSGQHASLLHGGPITLPRLNHRIRIIGNSHPQRMQTQPGIARWLETQQVVIVNLIGDAL